MQRLPVKTQCFAHFGISCELGNKKKWDERHMQHLPVKTMFLQFGLGNRKNRTGSTKVALTCDRRHLLVKRQCFAQFGIRSAACRAWSFLNRVWRQQDVKTSESETVRTRVCGMPHTAVGTVDGRNIQPFLSGTTPSPPKFNVNVIWSALAPMDESNP